MVDSPKLKLLKQLAKGLAAQFGNDCEVLIHDVSRKHTTGTIV